MPKKYTEKDFDQMIRDILDGQNSSGLGLGQPKQPGDRLQRFREASLRRKAMLPSIRGDKWTDYSK